jgi:hypothetical protein
MGVTILIGFIDPPWLLARIDVLELVVLVVLAASDIIIGRA